MFVVSKVLGWTLSGTDLTSCILVSAHMNMSALQFSYKQQFSFQKKLDFTLKVVGGDISSIPGLRDAIEVCECFLLQYLI